MKKILYTLFILSSLQTGIFAQQFPNYSLFIYNKMAYNPAYTGVPDAPCFTALHRSQWIGLEGAPTTQILSANLPFLKRKLGIGVQLTNQSIGITRIFSTDLNYAYHILIGKGELSVGLQGSIRYYSENYNDKRLTATQGLGIDNSIPVGLQNKYLPNFGAGLYYSTDQYYIGVSAARLLQNNIDFGNNDDFVSSEKPHYFIMGGYSFSLNEQVKFQPQALLKYVNNVPFDIEMSMGLELLEKYLFAVNYRAGGELSAGAGDSVDLVFGIQLSDKLMFALAYDITLSKIRKYNNGSVEAALQYCTGKFSNKNIANPRFF
jgi:type IX secretion system PorP/SprF family membrane protein